MSKTVQTSIPEWLIALPKKAKVSSRDFANALGLSSHGFHSRLHKQRVIPDADEVHACGKHFWYAANVRNHIRDLIKTNHQ